MLRITAVTVNSRSAYSGERERSFGLYVNTFFLNASPTEVCISDVRVQSTF